MRPGRRLLFLALTMIIVTSSHELFMVILGHGISLVFSGGVFVSLLVLIPAVQRYRKAYALTPAIGAFRAKLMMLVVSVILLTVYGYVRGNLLRLVLLDIWPYAAIFLFLVLGRYDQAWEDLEKPLILGFWALFLLCVLGLNYPKPLARGAGLISVEVAGQRGFTNSLGYDLNKLTYFWPIVLMLGYTRRRVDIWKILGLASILAFLTLQILFQKRAPVARAMAYLFTVALIVPLLQKKLKLGTTTIVLLGSLVVVFVVASVGTNWSYLIERYQGGAWGIGSERSMEASWMLNDLNLVEYVVGRGMGGYYTPPYWWTAGVGPVTRMGDMGRPFLHVGLLQPMLKGGFILLAIYYSFFFPMFFRKQPGWYQNRFNVVAMGALPVYTLFLLVEGPPTWVAPAEAFLVGFCCARLATPATVAEPEFDDEYLISDEYGYAEYAPQE